MATPVSEPRIRELLDSISQPDNGRYQIVDYLNEPGAWLKTFANDRVFTLLQATVADQGPSRTFFLVHSGGAYGATPDAGLFQALTTQPWRFEYGGPWATVTQDGLVSFGWRLLFPSDILCEENVPEVIGFLLGMIDNIGSVARMLAEELTPRYGGRIFQTPDEQAFPNLLAGVVPPG